MENNENNSDNINQHLQSDNDSHLYQVPPVTDCFKDIFNTDSSGDEKEEVSSKGGTVTSTAPNSTITNTTDSFSLNLPYLSTPRHDFARQYSIASSPSDFGPFVEEGPFPSSPLDSLDLGSLVSSPVKTNPQGDSAKSPVNLSSLLTLDMSISDDQFNDMLNETVDYLPSSYDVPIPPSKPAEPDPISTISSGEIAAASPPSTTIPDMAATRDTSNISNLKDSSGVAMVAGKTFIRTSPSNRTSTPVPQKSLAQNSTTQTLYSPKNTVPNKSQRIIINNKNMSKSNQTNPSMHQNSQRTYSYNSPSSNEHTPIRKLDLKTASSKDIVEALNDLITANESKVAYSRTRASGLDDTRRRRIRTKYPPSSVATKADYSKPLSIKPKPKSPSQLREEMGVNIIKQKVFRDLHGKPKSSNTSSTPKATPRSTASSTPPQTIHSTTHQAPHKTTSSKHLRPTNFENVRQVVSPNHSKTPQSTSSPIQNRTPQVASSGQNNSTIANESLHTNQNNLVPYTKPPPTGAPPTGNKKYLLLPVDNLQHVGPDTLQKLGLQPSVLEKLKRTVDTPSIIGSKRQKTDTMIDSNAPSFTERTQFPINIKLPSNMKDKFKTFPESIPDMMQKAKEKRKHFRSNVSAFGQMEAYISDFIKQNNEQVMEILFLKQNNRELNEKFNNLSKVFHLKTLEQKKLREEVDSLKIQNKKLEKEIRLIRDLIKKYIQ